MIRRAIQTAALQAQLFAAVLLVLVAGRFAVSALTAAIRDHAPALPALDQTPRSSSPAARLRARSDALLDLAASGGDDAGPAKDAAGEPLRVPLLVGGETPRSEVYVNGTLVGNSPFIGEVSCRAGEILRIAIVPPAGVPSEHRRQCVQGELRVEP